MNFIYDPSLVLYLPLYELDGTSFKSRDKHGHQCTVTGALWRPGGRYFDGNDDKLSLPAGIAPSGNSDRTIEVWCKRTDLTGVGAILTYGSYSAGKYFMIRSIATSGALQFVGHTINFNPPGLSLSPETYHHIVVTLSSGDGMTVYLDMSSVSTTLSGPLNTTDTAIDIGVDRRTPEAWWLGLISEFRIYNRALTSQEIHHNYLATKWRYR